MSTAIASEADKSLFDKIVGKWLFEVSISNSDVSITATEEYKNDGTIDTYGKVFVKGELVEEYKVKSKWEVVNGYSNVVILESSSDALKPGQEISDKIISVDDNEFTFESKDGVETTIIRIK